MSKTEAVKALAYGKANIIVADSEYLEFCDYLTTVMPNLRFANGKPVYKWIPWDGIKYIFYICRFPSSYFLGVTPYHEESNGVRWSELECEG